MIYPHDADSLMLWPRLLHEARIDTVLQEALTDLMQRGAALGLNRSGSLQLSAGKMPQAEYNDVRNSRLAPRTAKMATILARARDRDTSHPWKGTVEQTYLDLARRCDRGQQALQAAGPPTPANQEHWLGIAQALLDRLQMAQRMAELLYQAGYQGYWNNSNKHVDAYLNLMEMLHGMRLPHRVVGIAWPVQTPDGRLWVVDDPDVAVCRADLGQGPVERQEGEPVVTFLELGDIISLVEVARTDWMRGA